MLLMVDFFVYKSSVSGYHKNPWGTKDGPQILENCKNPSKFGILEGKHPIKRTI